MEHKPHVLVVGGDSHLREMSLALRIADSIEKGDIICIAGESLEEKAIKLQAIEIQRVCGMEDDFPVEPKSRFSDKWKGGTGPGSTAPIKRGKKR